MRFKSLPFLLFTVFCAACLQACSAAGPVHVYEGAERPVDELAHVMMPGPISVLEIDGVEADVPSVEDGFYHLYLLPGRHRLDFRYELYWGSPVSGYLVQSDPLAVETQLAAGRTYELQYPEPSDQHEAEKLAADFSARLVERETGRQIVARSPQELERSGTRTALVNQPISDGNATAAEYSSTPRPPRDIDADTAAREDALKRLKFWWLMANADERRRFLEWMRSLQPAADPADPDSR